MSKGKSTWRYNKLLTARRNYFDDGGNVGGPIDLYAMNANQRNHLGLSLPTIGSTYQKLDINLPTLSANNAPNIDQSIKDRLNNAGSSFNMGKAMGIAGLASTATSHVLGAINEAKGADISSIKADIKNQQMGPVMGSDSLDAIATDWGNLSTGRTYSAKDLGAKSTAGIVGGALTQGASGAAAGASLGPIGMIAGGIGGTVTSLFGSLFGNNKRKKQARQLTDLQATTDNFNVRSLQERTDNAMQNTFRNLERNYVNSAAFGGPIDTGALGYEFMNRYLNAKELLASGQNKTIASLPNSFNDMNTMSIGGFLSTKGADFSTGLKEINNGGSHESNPFEGVPMGVDPEGTPNLVEEGETIFNDYVFSRRLKVPKAIRNKYKLRDSISFADASKKLAKESEERPNDPISENGLVAIMNDLATSQEALKAKNQNNQFANGGKVNKFDGTSTMSNMIRKSKGHQGDYWNALMGSQLIERLKALDALSGDEREAAINEFISQANGLQDSYYNDIYNSGVTWGGRALAGKGKSHQTAWNNAGYNNYADYNNWFGARNHTGDRADTWVDNVIGDLTLLRNLGDSRYLTEAQAKQIRDLSSKLGLTYDEKGDGNTLMYFNRAAAPTVVEEAPVTKSTDKPVVTPEKEYTSTYTPEELNLGRNKLEPLRFAPALGFGIGAITDALGLTNKPDYSAADMILDASRNSIYRPVSFNPLGDYLTYKPQDVNRIANNLSAQAAATRAGIESLTGGNTGARAAQLLAADYNAQRQIGQAIMSATDANLAQEAQRAEFNRGTNMTNSQGFLQADIANQKALAAAGEFGMKGVLAAAQMREAARQSADAARSANLSGLFQTLGDIGYEAKNDNMVRRALERGIFGPGAEKVHMDMKRSKGGKLKKKKGLTF